MDPPLAVYAANKLSSVSPCAPRSRSRADAGRAGLPPARPPGESAVRQGRLERRQGPAAAGADPAAGVPCGAGACQLQHPCQ